MNNFKKKIGKSLRIDRNNRNVIPKLFKKFKKAIFSCPFLVINCTNTITSHHSILKYIKTSNIDKKQKYIPTENKIQ